jgi:hypothetical protein
LAGVDPIAIDLLQLSGWTVPELDDPMTPRYADGSVRIQLLSHVILVNPSGAFCIVDRPSPWLPYFEMQGKGTCPIVPSTRIRVGGARTGGRYHATPEYFEAHPRLSRSCGRQAPTVKLSREERKSLEPLTRRGTAEHRQVLRAGVGVPKQHGTRVYCGMSGTAWRFRPAPSCRIECFRINPQIKDYDGPP